MFCLCLCRSVKDIYSIERIRFFDIATKLSRQTHRSIRTISLVVDEEIFLNFSTLLYGVCFFFRIMFVFLVPHLISNSNSESSLFLGRHNNSNSMMSMTIWYGHTTWPESCEISWRSFSTFSSLFFSFLISHFFSSVESSKCLASHRTRCDTDTEWSNRAIKIS